MGCALPRDSSKAKMNRLLHGRFTNPANQRFAKHLRCYRDNLFVFLDRADVEATNYPAEQDIRIAVVNRKTCGGGNRTAKGAQAQSILMSVLQKLPSQRDPRDRHRHVNPSCSRQHPRPLGQPRAVNNYNFLLFRCLESVIHRTDNSKNCQETLNAENYVFDDRTAVIVCDVFRCAFTAPNVSRSAPRNMGGARPIS